MIRPASLPDAELAEDGIEQIFGGGAAHDLSDGVDRDAQIRRHQFQGQVRAHRLNGLLRSLARAFECFLMPRIDHHLEHLRLDFTCPHQLLDGVLQRFHSLPADTPDVDVAWGWSQWCREWCRGWPRRWRGRGRAIG